MNAPFEPKKFSPRMWCICRDIDIRTNFISGIKTLRTEARALYDRWKKGGVSVPYPTELFAPQVPMMPIVRDALIPHAVSA